MSTYKITNITNYLGKRDYKFNSNIDVEFVDNMVKKTITLKPNDVAYLSIPSLPLSVHRLRVKNFITVSEVNNSEINDTQTKVLQKPEFVGVSQAEPKKEEEKKPEKKVVEKKE